MAGIDAATGKVITDNWLHTVQSIEIIMSTRFFERIERRHIGNPALELLGKYNLTPETWLVLMAGVPAALAVTELNGLAREPRFDVKVVERWQTTVGTARAGRVGIHMRGIYRPRGHLGDPTPEGVRAVNAFAAGSRFTLESAT